MVDQVSKSAEEEAQLRKNTLETRQKHHGTGNRNVLKDSNPDAGRSKADKDGVSKSVDEQNLTDAVTRPGPDRRRK